MSDPTPTAATPPTPSPPTPRPANSIGAATDAAVASTPAPPDVAVPSVSAAGAENAGRRTGLILAVAALTQLLVVLDSSIVNVALPSMDRALGFSPAALSWVVNAYVLVFGGLLLLSGRIADLIGLRRALFAGLAVFAVASILGGLAQSPAELIAARAAQGLAGAALAPVSLTTIVVTFTDGAGRYRALTVWAMVGAGGSAVGVLLGGVLTQLLDWRWVLFVNVPIVAVVAGLGWVSLYDPRPSDRRRLDIAGATVGTIALGLLVYGLLGTAEHGWTSPRTIVTLVIAAVLAAVFLIVERRQSHPLVRLGVFAEGHVGLATVITLAVGAASISGFYFSSLFLQDVLHYSALRAGVCFLPFCVGIAAGSFAGRALIARLGPRVVLSAGLLVGGAGLSWFAALDTHSTFLTGFLGPSLVASVGIGAALVTTTVLATAGVAAHEAGLVSGLVNAGRQIGGSLGLAVLTTVAVSTARNPAASAEAALGHGYTRALLAAGLTVVVAGFLAAFLVRPEKTRTSR